MATVFAQTTGDRLNRKAGKAELLALFEAKGEERVEKAWEHWITTRNLDGSECPLVHFVNEFEETEVLIQTAAEKTAARVKEVEPVEASQKADRVRRLKEIAEEQEQMRRERERISATANEI